MTPIRLLVTQTKDGDYRAEIRMGTPSEPFAACSLTWDADRARAVSRAVKDWRFARKYLLAHPNPVTE